MLGQKPCGLLVSERLVNMPGELLAPLHTALADDLAWAVQNEPAAEDRAFFQVASWVAIVRCERATAQQKPQPGAKPARGRGGGRSGGRGGRGTDARAPRQPAGASSGSAGAVDAGVGEWVAQRPDEEVLRQAATLAFPVASRLPARRGRGPPTRLFALLLSAEAMRALPARLDALAAES